MSHGRVSARSALHEVTTKSAAAIDRATAYRWASRALACYTKFSSTRRINWLLRAEDARHEALEHAGTSDPSGRLVRAIARQLAAVRRKLR